MSYLPEFQAQNPAISGYRLGWSSCTAFAAAMAIDFDSLGRITPTGGQVRTLTGDTTGGLTLAQVDHAALEGWDVNLATTYSLPWSDFAKSINAGCGAILQGGYAPIADSRFDAGAGFRGNHAVFVAPGWVGMDPLADGRRTGIYKYHEEAYPQSLLRTFAGHLNLNTAANPVRLGDGLVYASFTRDNVHTYHLNFTGGSFWVYHVVNGVITPDSNGRARHAEHFPKPTGAPCGSPRLTRWPGHSSKALVKVTAGALAGEYVAVPQSTLKLELVP